MGGSPAIRLPSITRQGYLLEQASRDSALRDRTQAALSSNETDVVKPSSQGHDSASGSYAV